MSTTPEELDPESLVRRYYDLVDDEEYEALFDLFTDDVVYERPGQAPIEGKAAFEAFYGKDRPLEDGAHEVDAVVVDDGADGEGGGDGSDDADGEGGTGDDASDANAVVAVRGTFSGVQNGDPVRFGFADFHEFDGDRIARRYTYTDRDEV